MSGPEASPACTALTALGAFVRLPPRRVSARSSSPNPFHAAAHILILSLLAGCDHLPRTVNVPVPVACVKPEQIPARPPLTIDDKQATRGARARALLLYQAEAQPYIESLEAIALHCSRLK